MATTIQIKRGTNANPTNLMPGELALRLDTGELFTSDGSNIIKIGGKDLLSTSGGTLTGQLIFNVNGIRIATVNNDLWITANAYWDGSNWQRDDTSKFSFGLQLQGYNNIPGESMQGVNLWRCVPGTNPIGNFGAFGGWEIVQIWTAYKDAVLGGFGLEIDGHGTFPYGRFVHLTYDSKEYTGILTNLFTDFSGRDQTTEPSWFIGRRDDEFVVLRMAGGSGASLVRKFRVDASGNTFITPLTAEPETSNMEDGELAFFVNLDASVLKAKYKYDSSHVYVFNVAFMQ